MVMVVVVVVAIWWVQVSLETPTSFLGSCMNVRPEYSDCLVVVVVPTQELQAGSCGFVSYFYPLGLGVQGASIDRSRGAV